MAHFFDGKSYFTRDYMQGNFIPKNLKLPTLKPAPKPRAKASSSGEHVQLFHTVYHRKKGFQAKHFVCFSCFIAFGNMGVKLKFHVPHTFLCLHAFGTWVEVKVYSYNAGTQVCVGSCMRCAQAAALSKLQ